MALFLANNYCTQDQAVLFFSKSFSSTQGAYCASPQDYESCSGSEDSELWDRYVVTIPYTPSPTPDPSVSYPTKAPVIEPSRAPSIPQPSVAPTMSPTCDLLCDEEFYELVELYCVCGW